jgi:hypothetical protein
LLRPCWLEQCWPAAFPSLTLGVSEASEASQPASQPASGPAWPVRSEASEASQPALALVLELALAALALE